MADPTQQIVFRGAARDAEVLRERFNALFRLAPKGSVVEDPERRAKLAKSAGHVVEITVELALVQEFVPGKTGQVFGKLISGVEKDPATGKLSPGPAVAGNFLPSPLGFLDPTTVGVKRNFYLPAGSTYVIPGVADRIGLGIPEQRAEDDARRYQRITDANLSLLARARRAVESESGETLQGILADQRGFTRSGFLIATSEVPLPQLQGAAREELIRRARAVNPLNAPVSTGSIQPAAIKPVSAAALTNQETAEGLRRELVHERADP